MDGITNSVVLALRFDKSSSRQQIDSIDFNSTVDAFRNRVSHVLNLTVKDFALLYHGHNLRDNKTLQHYGVKPGSTVDVIKNPVVHEPELDRLDSEKVKQIRRGVTALLTHKSQRQILEQILKTSESVENLIAATPGLDNDTIALGLVQDLEMFILAATSERETLIKLIEDHPAFGHAALHLIATVAEEGAKAKPNEQAATSRESYAIDRVSDDENEDDEEEMDIDNILPTMNRPPQVNANGAPSIITTDFFRQAIMMATGEAVNPPASGVTQAQLDQLRDMGITDEAVARRALEQSGGDINLALEMIFGDGLF